MNSSDKRIRAAIAQQAGDWLAASEDLPMSDRERAAFSAWLKTSPVHVEEFLGVSVIARDLAAAADDPETALDTLIEQARAEPADNVVAFDDTTAARTRLTNRLPIAGTWTLAAAAAAVVVLVAATLLWRTRDGEFLGIPRTYETSHGEQAAWTLADGSQLRLNSDTAVTVHYSGRERVIDVDRGEALFQVAHDRNRRFRVAAGDGQVLAVGTEFDVYRRPGRTLITVVDGAVAVVTGAVPPLADGLVVPQYALRVSAGQQLGIESGHLWARPAPVDVHAAVAWLQRQIIVRDRPLGEVADEFNRYAMVPIVIDDAALRALPVSGRFDAYDTESFTRFLESLDGVTVKTSSKQIRVGAAPPGERGPAPEHN